MTPDFIRTHSGAKFHFMNPKSSEIVLDDIVWALSRICRFNGHTKGEIPYSVLQHLCHCHDAAPEGHRRESLCHDFSEAQIADLASPVKAIIPQYRDVERRIEIAIANKFKLRYPWSAEVKTVDLTMLATEMRDLMKHADYTRLPYPPLNMRIKPWPAKKARAEFMKRWRLYA